ncbi:MAG: universal stress protein [Candidatus Thorarchaeota archaeon]
MYKKILLATDGSEHAHNAAKKAVEFRKIWNSEVVIIHSIKDNRVSSELYPNIETLYSKYSSIEEVNKEAGNRLLKRTKRMFGENQPSVEIRLVENESPKD